MVCVRISIPTISQNQPTLKWPMFDRILKKAQETAEAHIIREIAPKIQTIILVKIVTLPSSTKLPLLLCPKNPAFRTPKKPQIPCIWPDCIGSSILFLINIYLIFKWTIPAQTPIKHAEQRLTESQTPVIIVRPALEAFTTVIHLSIELYSSSTGNCLQNIYVEMTENDEANIEAITAC